MKITKRMIKISLGALSFALFSCASNDFADELQTDKPAVEKDGQETSESGDVAVGHDASSFIAMLDGVSMSVESAPRETTKLKPFPSAFSVKVTKDGNALPNFGVAVSYPASRDAAGKTVYRTATLETDLDGNAIFMPPVPTFAFRDKISFEPAFSEAVGDSVAEEIAGHGTTAEFNVRTNMRNAGGVISLLEYKKDGTAVLGDSISSSKLLINLIKAGFTRIGNDDFTPAIKKGDTAKIYSDTRRYNGSMAYLIFGTVKYDEDAEDGEVALVADVSCMNLKAESADAGNLILFSTTKRAAGKTVSDAREAISAALASEIDYGM